MTDMVSAAPGRNVTSGAIIVRRFALPQPSLASAKVRAETMNAAAIGMTGLSPRPPAAHQLEDTYERPEEGGQSKVRTGRLQYEAQPDRQQHVPK